MVSEDLKIKLLIVDSDEGAQSQIEDVLTGYKEFDLIQTCRTGAEALVKIQSNLPDVIFLETELEDMTGFELIQQMYPLHSAQFIFITELKHHAIKAFEYFAFDYILKPFTPERLHLTLLKVKEDIYKRKNGQLQDKLNALFRYVSDTKSDSREKKNGALMLPVKMGGRIYFIREEEIQYIVASGYYVEIYANEKKHLLRQSLSAMIERLDAKKFMRIHRSVIISLKYLKEINRMGMNDFSVRMEDGSSFRISKSYKGNVFEKIGIRS